MIGKTLPRTVNKASQASEILADSAEAHHVLARRYPQARIQRIPFAVHPITPPLRTDLHAAHGVLRRRAPGSSD